MILTLLIQMDSEGLAFTARYKDAQSTGKGFALSGHVDGKPGTDWVKEFPEKGVGQKLKEMEEHLLVKFIELTDNGAFDPKQGPTQ